MVKHDSRYGTPRWKRLRRLRLEIDNWHCTIPHPNCKYQTPGSLKHTTRKAHVHHINPPVNGGPFWDITNLTTVCATYNIAERNQRWNRQTTTPTPSRQW